ncbi:Carboxysome shell and ethanolamine utilization microcompartment protein CcmL/EutN [Caloramator quimbayensis]|uniref:Carboxysome shell and ethanolamine utilization microcompartment protein CcmL/EutN n=1 Tax=Caloramator quimbayensis TaxID=1147123 RepID=A0A1T4WF24_9CLOT|nr:BMC domain-containing protein [Caloramator quimbayensis]SKA75946.1 Carboxysome shell and ethanolamine utilization microcompartment protein CcmL/EutN [Caloramator quimbayensis]
MQALGLIETIGLIAAIESADAMLKAADVTLLEKVYVGGGLVSITVAGDVGAVKAAVDAGAAAVNMISSTFLISQHVIPRPHEELIGTIISEVNLKDKDIIELPLNKADEEMLPKVIERDTANSTETINDVVVEKKIVEDLQSKELDAKELIEDKNDSSLDIDLSKLKNKKAIDKMVLECGLEQTIQVLNKFKVVELRNLSRKYKNFGIKGRLISKADKNLLLKEFREYYEHNQ